MGFFCVVPGSFSAQNVQKHENSKKKMILITSKVKKLQKSKVTLEVGKWVDSDFFFENRPKIGLQVNIHGGGGSIPYMYSLYVIKSC